MAAYRLAHALHKTVSEVMGMTQDEWHGWLAYFKLENERSGTGR